LTLTALFQLIVQLCLRLSVKFGLAVMIAISAKVDICLNLLIVNLSVCAQGIAPTIAKM
jgi:hypothetical protein